MNKDEMKELEYMIFTMSFLGSLTSLILVTGLIIGVWAVATTLGGL